MSHQPLFIPYSSLWSRIAGLFLACFVTSLISVPGLAQDGQAQTEVNLNPIFVTTRIFQLSAKRGSYQDLSEQVFKMNTASLSDHDKWMRALKKTYPQFEITQLRTEARRVFRTSKPATISMIRQPDGRDVGVQLYGAQSLGDGVKPGTSLIPEIALHFGNDRTQPPVSYAIQPLEVETATTYFFVVKNLKLGSPDYVKFVRPNAKPESFDGREFFLVFAFSVDIDKTVQPARLFDETQSAPLQEKASKKVQPEMPAALRDAGLGGVVRTRIEISPEGKVSSANIYNSSFPEINDLVIAAVRQWEFPASLFAEDKNPITAILTFSFQAQPISGAAKQ